MVDSFKQITEICHLGLDSVPLFAGLRQGSCLHIVQEPNSIIVLLFLLKNISKLKTSLGLSLRIQRVLNTAGIQNS